MTKTQTSIIIALLAMIAFSEFVQLFMVGSDPLRGAFMSVTSGEGSADDPPASGMIRVTDIGPPRWYRNQRRMNNAYAPVCCEPPGQPPFLSKAAYYEEGED
jgi:hypothetical protein